MDRVLTGMADDQSAPGFKAVGQDAFLSAHGCCWALGDFHQDELKFCCQSDPQFALLDGVSPALRSASVMGSGEFSD